MPAETACPDPALPARPFLSDRADNRRPRGGGGLRPCRPDATSRRVPARGIVASGIVPCAELRAAQDGRRVTVARLVPSAGVMLLLEKGIPSQINNIRVAA